MTYPENRPTNPNDRDDFEETVNSRPATDSEVAYRDGYVSGTASEREIQRERAIVNENNQALRDNENAGRGLLLGLLLAGLLGAGALAAYLASRPEPEVAPATNTIVVPGKAPSPSPSAVEPKKETTVIERTVEKAVPVPQTAPPKVEVNTPPPAPAPKVEVNVPPAPAPKVDVNVPPAPAPKVDVNVPPSQPAPSAPSSEAPGSAVPGSAAPGSAAPGSAAPGSAAPGSAAPGGTGGASGSGSN